MAARGRSRTHKNSEVELATAKSPCPLRCCGHCGQWRTKLRFDSYFAVPRSVDRCFSSAAPAIEARHIAAGNAGVEAVRNNGGKPIGGISRILKSGEITGTVSGNGGSGFGTGA